MTLPQLFAGRRACALAGAVIAGLSAPNSSARCWAAARCAHRGHPRRWRSPSSPPCMVAEAGLSVPCPAVPYNGAVYTWSTPVAVPDGVCIKFDIGFLIDQPDGDDDAGGELRLPDGAYLHHRLHGGRSGLPAAFSAISPCSPSPMLMLVMSEQLPLQLFFGWEAVGLVSYLLIGFLVHRVTHARFTPTSRPFPVNRVGDFGFPHRASAWCSPPSAALQYERCVCIRRRIC